LIATKWGWLVIGIGLLVGGLIWGLNSHQASYMHSDSQTKYDVSTGTTSGNTYINVDETDNYYVAFSIDFIVPQDTINRATSYTFIARTDTSTLNPPLHLSDGTTIDSAHKIEKLVFYDQQNNVLATYTTAEYASNPNGYDDNNWPYASLLMLAGVLCAGTMLFFIVNGRKYQKLALAAERAALEARPSIFARELDQGTTQTAQQPYEGIGQYPQSASPSTQVSRPYQAPQE